MKKTLITLIACILLAISSAVSYGEEKGKKDITMEEAITLASKEVPGEVIKAEFEKGYYEIKIRTAEGRIEKLYVDPRDGSILRKGKRSSDKR